MVVDLSLWQSFKNDYNLSEEKICLFKKFVSDLLDFNKKTNLTALDSLDDIINYHLRDSLALLNYIDISGKTLVDVGSGAGFPGLPLAIATDCYMQLLEIREKRIEFLNFVKNNLSLDNITVDHRDWLTFIRAKRPQVDYYIARASLQPEDLIKVLNIDPQATVIYWASAQWEPSSKISGLIVRDELYLVGDRQRRLIFFQKNKESR